MYAAFSQETLCNIPAFFYPTTLLLVDDDPEFLARLSSGLKKYYKTLEFTDSNQAIAFLMKEQDSSFINDKTLEKLDDFRQRIYNRDRFKVVLISVIDYDMPDKSGFDLMKHVGLNDYYKKHSHSYILLTAKRYTDFDKDLAHDAIGRHFISKHDPLYMEQLLESINKQNALIFQGASHTLANALAHDSHEKTSFLNDGNFLSVLNPYLKENDICEGYLFDKQGSLMLLNKQGHLRWLFVRNEKGMENSISLARHYHAPQSVIEALTSKQFILSLYEKEDFERRSTIDWDNYLLKAQVFKDEGKMLAVFNHCPSDYYYAFTSDFPEHGIDNSKILSYDAFMKNN